MKIAVTYENGNVFQHFGHSEHFKIYDVTDGKIVGEQVVDTNGSGHGALAGFLKDNGVNVLDISQTIVSGYFNMMMIVDMASAKKHFADISSEMEALGEEIGVSIKCQREEIFEKMHRI